ncbi:MAG: hypothetical protein F6K23_33195 [Okeania sp. SIO2C9]|nr:hypothetical protein [Okeania sp. SIO2C9]
MLLEHDRVRLVPTSVADAVMGYGFGVSQDEAKMLTFREFIDFTYCLLFTIPIALKPLENGNSDNFS